jgi:uncharacterized protein (DUF1499 family)
MKVLSIVKWLLVGLGVLVLAVLVVGQLGLLQGTPPADLGVREGLLKAPSTTPNSVHSQSELWPGHPQGEYARIAPLALKGSPQQTMSALRRVVQSTPGAVVIKAEGDYLYATFTTRWLKFTDDVEFWFDPAMQVVQVRSASRLGKKDLGVNRARVEALRARLASTS